MSETRPTSGLRHVVMFSGGAGSFEAAWRVVQQHGRHAVTLLFMDTRTEDADLYRFLIEAAALLTGRAGLSEVSGLSALAANTPPVWERAERKRHLSGLQAVTKTILPQLVWLSDGRDIWDTFAESRFLGNSYRGICTNRLKQQIADGWRRMVCQPESTVCYVGVDWSESHRYDRLKEKMAADGWRYEAPLCDAPYVEKDDILAHMRALGIRPPRLYELGFAHNNCGGGCVKAGIGHFTHLYRKLPDVFAHWEHEENNLRATLGDVSMLTDRRGGAKKPLPLASLRARIEANDDTIDQYEIGGCGCFVDTPGPVETDTGPIPPIARVFAGLTDDELEAEETVREAEFNRDYQAGS